ncbi:major capsid protein [Capybara microvirus Cap3_SP_264]|nr:major capsid protein [Capybara microvirus Cap3_SP_264]
MNPNVHNVSNDEKLKKTQYSLDHSNHLSGRIGQLLPVLTMECVPGDSIKIRPQFNLRFAATTQPLQNRTKAVIDYFFVPFKALWKNSNSFFRAGMNNVGNPPAHPYVKCPTVFSEIYKRFGVGSLLDYLGVPTYMNHDIAYSLTLPLYNQFDVQEGKEMDIFYNNSIISLRNHYKNDHTQYAGKAIIQHLIDEPSFIYNYSNTHLLSSDFTREGLNKVFVNNTNTVNILCGTWLAPPALSRKTLFSNGLLKDLPNSMFKGNLALTTKQYCINDHFDINHREIVFYGGNTYNIGNNRNLVFVVAKCPLDWRPNGSFVGNGDFLAVYDIPSSDISSVGFNANSNAQHEISVKIPEEAIEYMNVLQDNVLQDNERLIFGLFTAYDANTDFSNNSKLGWFSPSTLYKTKSQQKLSALRGAASQPTLKGMVKGEAFDYSPDFGMSPSYNLGNGSASLVQLNKSYAGFVGNFEDAPCNYLGISCSFALLSSAPDFVAALQSSPFVGDNPKYPINALLPRAYECCYNYWYRNQDIDYLRQDADGKPSDSFEGTTRVVDQYLTDSQMADGADEHNYVIHNALLEKDMFTSCLTQPLVNYNPLIGIRQKENNSSFDFAVKDGVVTITAEHVGDGFDLENAKVSSYSTSLQDTEISVLKDIIATGITLADIRSAESLKRFISNKVQKGYDFNSQQFAQFGVSSDWNPITAPQYLGSAAQWINNGCITDSDGDDLGRLAGLPTCRSNGAERTIVCHAHERGIVIGIMRVVPIPIYSQAIDPFLIVPDFTEYFHPEFDNKGWEHVKGCEIAPLIYGNSDNPHEVFGYNVAYHRYKSKFDQMHGEMRRDFNQTVLMRDFAVKPTLSRSFIECQADQYNNVFADTHQTDKFIGEIFHSIDAVRPITNYQSRV